MKSVLMSIQPKWCELIASGKKTVEVRKTKPKLETPFKVYIYCMKPRHYYKISRHLLTSDESLFLVNGKVRMCDGFGVEYEDSEYKHLNRKVIGEFVCEGIEEYHADDYAYGTYDISDDEVIKTGLVNGSLWDYGKGQTLYGWHISNLAIYDKPKELSEFKTLCTDFYDGKHCDECEYFIDGRGYEYDESDCGCDGLKPLKRPPQSWCYVESEVDVN